MNRELIITVRALINKYGQEIYTNSKKLRAFLNDYYPEQYTREKRLIVDSVDQKIPEIIINYSGTEIDNLMYTNLVKKLYDNLGVSQDLAEGTIQCWCQIFDKTFVRFGNATPNFNGTGFSGVGQSNMYNSQARLGMSMNPNQQRYEDQTVFMNSAPQNNSEKTYKTDNKKKIIIGATAVMIVAIAGVIGFFSTANKKNVATQATTTETKKGEKKEETNRKITSNDFIFKDSSEKKIESFKLYNLTSDQLYIARNEILARHGYVFKEKKLQAYFEKQAWYKPNPNITENTYNQIEKDNVEHIKEIEEVKLCFKNAPVINRDFIISDSDHYKLKTEDIEKLSNLEILLARNEIFARHGYIFGVPELNDYFQTKRWYRKVSNNVNLNDVETYNVEALKKVEDRRVYNMLYNYTLSEDY